MAVGAVGDIASGKDAGEVSFCAFALKQIAVRVHVEFPSEGLGVGRVSNSDKHAFEVQLRGRAGHEIFYFYRRHFAFCVGDVLLDCRVPDGFDFGICEGAIGHDFGRAEGFATVDEVDLRCESGEEGGFFARGVAAADNADGNVAIKRAVAGSAGR